MTTANAGSRGLIPSCIPAIIPLIILALVSFDAAQGAKTMTPGAKTMTDPTTSPEHQGSDPGDASRAVRIVEEVVTGFDPAVHGWAIRNSFEGLPISLGLLDELLPRDSRYGLCGGMCFSALDAYYAGVPIPRDLREEPARDSALYKHFRTRQRDTLGFALRRAVRYTTWTFRSDATVLRDTAPEIAIAMTKLRAGRPAPLGLIYASREKPAVWENHQVLAVGATIFTNGAMRFVLYDPNFPDRRDVTLDITPEGECSRIAPGRHPRPVRGFFVNPYKRVSIDPAIFRP